jgi:Asp-tRNA(Asn)/Glu-tRNA(Gln) amidotransferase A subunit family amidase
MNDLVLPINQSPTIAQASESIQKRKRTCVEVLQECLNRVDLCEPRVHAWVIVDRDGAMRQAIERDAEIAAGNWRGSLHGIPIGIKDIVDVASFPTSAGSPLLKDNMAQADATIVTRLRQAGAVIVGKTVTTQFASFDPPVTRNPWNLDRTPGGSSSGSAAAVACSMCLGAIGSQTGGSITRPAAFCGVAGCKPTFGRVSTVGVLPLAPSMDHPGPIARTVRDLAIVLDAIAGPDDRDSLCSPQVYLPIAGQLSRPIDRPPRIGVLRGLFWELAEPAARDSITRTCDRFTASGAVVRDVALPTSFSDVIRSHMVIMSVEAAAEHESRFREHSQSYSPKIRGLIEAGLRSSATDYARAKKHQRELSHEILRCFGDADVLITPAALGPAPDVSTTGDPAFNSPWSFTGLPTVSIPIGGEPGTLPVAIQFIGAPFQELALFRAAGWCEEKISGISRGA